MANLKKPFLPREGLFTADAVVVLLKNTLFNASITLPAFLVLQLTSHGRSLFSRTKLFPWAAGIVGLGVVGRINGFLSRKAANNWLRDTFVPSREIVVVTGGSQGIGAVLVQELTAAGRDLKAVVVVDVQPLQYTAAANVHFYQADLSSSANIEEVCARIKAEIGDPTVLINNAGVCRGKTVLEETARDVELTFSVNAMAHFHLVRQFLPAMVAANHGHIVTVASIVSYISAPQMVSYSASKAAAQALHEGLGLELKFRYAAPKVRTTLVSQGHVKTPLFEGFKDGGFMLPPLEPLTVAEAVVEKVFAQESGHVVLPRAYNLFTGIRGWPTWRQLGVRAKTHDVMSKWEGKQVLD